MSLEGLDVFVSVVRNMSFSGAAKHLQMPSSTVSAKIARLEERLGVTLLHRTTRKLRLTEAGEIYFEHGQRALAEIAEAEHKLAENVAEPAGTLRLTAPADICHSILAPIIEQFLQTHPKIRIDLITSNEMLDLVGNGIDLAVRVGHLKDSSLVARKFLTTRMVFWTTDAYLQKCEHPVSSADLDRHTLIMLAAARDSGLTFAEDNKPLEFDWPTRVIVDDLQTCQHLLQQGIGIGLLPEFTQTFPGKQSNLVRILQDCRSQEFTAYFLYPQQTFVPPTVRKFIELALTMTR